MSAAILVSLNLQEELVAALQVEGQDGVLHVDLARARVAWPMAVQRAVAQVETVIEKALADATKGAESAEDAADEARADAHFAARCDADDVLDTLREVLKVEALPLEAKVKVEKAIADCGIIGR